MLTEIQIWLCQDSNCNFDQVYAITSCYFYQKKRPCPSFLQMVASSSARWNFVTTRSAEKNVIQLHPNIFSQICSFLLNKRGTNGLMQSQEDVRTNPRTVEIWLSVFLGSKTIEFLTLNFHKDKLHSLPRGTPCQGVILVLSQVAQIIQHSLTAGEKYGNSTFQNSFCNRGPELEKLES